MVDFPASELLVSVGPKSCENPEESEKASWNFQKLFKSPEKLNMKWK